MRLFHHKLPDVELETRTIRFHQPFFTAIERSLFNSPELVKILFMLCSLRAILLNVYLCGPFNFIFSQCPPNTVTYTVVLNQTFACLWYDELFRLNKMYLIYSWQYIENNSWAVQRGNIACISTALILKIKVTNIDFTDNNTKAV